MAQIKYLDSRRIMGESDGTDIAPTFEDKFSSDNWTDQDSAVIGVNTTTSAMVYDAERGSNDNSHYDLGTTLSDSNWVWDFDYVETSLSSGGAGDNSIHIYLSSAPSTTNSETSADRIGIGISQFSARQAPEPFYTDGSTIPATGSRNHVMSITNTVNTNRYVRIIRTSPTQYRVIYFTTASRTVELDEHTQTIPSTVTGLRYVIVGNESSANANATNQHQGKITSMKIYNGVTSVTIGKPSPALSLSGCKAYYNFEQTSGSLTNIATTANEFDDGLGSSADGTVTGATQNATGKVGSSAYSFDGSNDTVQLGSSYSDLNFLHDGSSWSIAFWFKDDNSSQTSRIFCTMDDRSGSQRGISLVHETTGLNLGVFTGTASQYPFASTIASVFTDTNTWHHYVLTFTTGGSTATLYKDGSSFGTWTKTGASFNTSNATQYPYIASRFNYDSFMGGDIDEFVIFNRALTSSEVSTLYNGGTGVAVNDSSITAKPETNSIFVETDTANRYWFDGSDWAANLLNTSEYISSNFTGNPSSYISIANNAVTFSSMPTNADYYLYKSIPSLNPNNKFILNFKFNASSAATYDAFFLSLRDVITNMYTGDGLQLQVQGGTYNRFTFNKCDNGSLIQTSSSNGTWSANTNYWCSITHDGSGTVSFKVWTNSARSGSPSITLTRTISGLNNFNYIYHGGKNSGDSNIFSGTVSEIVLVEGKDTI